MRATRRRRTCEHDPEAFSVEDARVEAHQGMHGLVLGGSRDVCMHHQVGQERLDRGFGGEEGLARPPAVETGESDDPLHRGTLLVHPGVVRTVHLPHGIETCG